MDEKSVPPPPPGCERGFLYTVKPCDRLHLIARRFELSADRLIAANPQLHDPEKLACGQQICIPVEGREGEGDAVRKAVRYLEQILDQLIRESEHSRDLRARIERALRLLEGGRG